MHKKLLLLSLFLTIAPRNTSTIPDTVGLATQYSLRPQNFCPDHEHRRERNRLEKQENHNGAPDAIQFQDIQDIANFFKRLKEATAKIKKEIEKTPSAKQFKFFRINETKLQAMVLTSNALKGMQFNHRARKKGLKILYPETFLHLEKILSLHRCLLMAESIEKQMNAAFTAPSFRAIPGWTRKIDLR